MKFSAIIIAALASIGAVDAQRRETCDRERYALLASQVRNTAYFCRFYNRDSTRTQSPLADFTPGNLRKYCRCHIQNAPNAPRPFVPANPRPAPSGCPTSLYRPLRNQYVDVDGFCRFWRANGRRNMSPLPSMNQPADVYEACRCWLARRFAPQQSSISSARASASSASSSRSASSAASAASAASRSLSSLSTTTTTTTTTTTEEPTTTLLPTDLFPTTTTPTTTTTTEETTSETTSTGITEAPTSTASGTATESGSSTLPA